MNTSLSKNTFHFSVLLLTAIATTLACWLFYRSFFPPGPVDLAVYTMVVLAAAAIHIVERHFTKPADAIVNAAGTLLVIVPLSGEPFGSSSTFVLTIGYCFVVLLTSMGAAILFNPLDSAGITQKISRVLKEISVHTSVKSSREI